MRESFSSRRPCPDRWIQTSERRTRGRYATYVRIHVKTRADTSSVATAQRDRFPLGFQPRAFDFMEE